MATPRTPEIPMEIDPHLITNKGEGDEARHAFGTGESIFEKTEQGVRAGNKNAGTEQARVTMLNLERRRRRALEQAQQGKDDQAGLTAAREQIENSSQIQ